VSGNRNNQTLRTNHGARRIGLVVLVVVVTTAILALVALRHFTSPAYIEKQLGIALSPDGSYDIDVGSSSYHPIRRSFVAHDISLVPDTLAEVGDAGKTRVWFRASSLHVDGIGLSALRRNINFASVRVDSPRVEIFVDRTLPSSTTKKAPATLPHVHLKRNERSIRIAAVYITNGDLTYYEKSRGGTRPGAFRFADLSAVVNNVTNDTTRMDIPCTIEVRTRLADSGLMNATFEYDFKSRALDLDYRATVGKRDALALNDLLVDLEGIHVTSGTIDSTSFDFKVKDDVATGTLRVLYTDVEFEMLDKNTGEQGIEHHLAGFLSDTRESNPPDDDEPPIVVTIRRVREPEVSLVKFVWENVREGLLRTLGVQ